jgi:hypothetical protein
MMTAQLAACCRGLGVCVLHHECSSYMPCCWLTDGCLMPVYNGRVPDRVGLVGAEQAQPPTRALLQIAGHAQL